MLPLDFAVLEERNFNLPYIYQNGKVLASQIKEDTSTKGFSGSQLSLSPLNKKCLWLLVRAYGQVTALSLFPSPLLFKEGILQNVDSCGGGFSPALSLSPSLSVSLSACTKLFFFLEVT